MNLSRLRKWKRGTSHGIISFFPLHLKLSKIGKCMQFTHKRERLIKATRNSCRIIAVKFQNYKNV